MNCQRHKELCKMDETLDYFECPECGDYSPEGGWCESCLDKVDIEEHEERRREWLAEQQEY